MHARAQAMTPHPPRRTRLVVVSAIAGLLLLVAAPALAHVTAEPGEATAGGYTMINLRVPHGCDGAATTSVTVQIPDTVASVTPQFIPGWDVETTTGPLAEPVELHGETVDDGIREVTWSGGTPIPDGVFFDFGISALMPDAAGETLYFPTVQTCGETETAWVEVPEEGGDGHDLETPAPFVTLTAAADSGHDHGAGPDAEETRDAGEVAAAEEVPGELAAASQPADRGDGMTVVALVVAALALVVGVAALVTARRRQR